MSKYHINAKGEPGRCRAKDGKCPFGSESEHYENKSDARFAYEKKLEEIEFTSNREAKRLFAIASGDAYKASPLAFMSIAFNAKSSIIPLKESRDFMQNYLKLYNLSTWASYENLENKSLETPIFIPDYSQSNEELVGTISDFVKHHEDFFSGSPVPFEVTSNFPIVDVQRTLLVYPNGKSKIKSQTPIAKDIQFGTVDEAIDFIKNNDSYVKSILKNKTERETLIRLKSHLKVISQNKNLKK